MIVILNKILMTIKQNSFFKIFVLNMKEKQMCIKVTIYKVIRICKLFNAKATNLTISNGEE